MIEPLTEAEIEKATLAVDELGMFAASFNNRHNGLQRLFALVAQLESAHPRESACLPVLNSALVVLAAMANLLRCGGKEISAPEPEKEEAVQ